jgi:hypothetical protein
MSKYSPKARKVIEETMHEFSEGKLNSGSGQKVTDKDQAIAIGISEARKKHLKVPRSTD